uniref:HAUS augmin-like complex, subunit 7 n=1 Tax=Oryzias latipes TaxID=8090 RepID=H2L9G3_ORYLA
LVGDQEAVFVLQAASCPLLPGLDLREADTMLQLLCSPSELRSSILAWIFSRYKPPSASGLHFPQDGFTAVLFSRSLEMAAVGEELMLCRKDDFDLIRGNTSPLRQLCFLEQLLTLISDTAKPCGSGEALLSELFADENLPHLRQMLEPALNPWPVNIRSVRVPSVQHSWKHQQKSPSFCASSLRLAAGDLQQLMTTFCPVYESNLKAHCSREPPSFSTGTDIFQRVLQLLQACNTVNWDSALPGLTWNCLSGSCRGTGDSRDAASSTLVLPSLHSICVLSASSGAGDAEPSARSFCMFGGGGEAAADSASLLESRRKAHVG